MDRKMVNFIKEQYPSGTRIRLDSMDDPYAPIAPGTEGEVDFVDDMGQLHMKWDDGRTLSLIPGEDRFTVLPPKLTTLKLYMPLTFPAPSAEAGGRKFPRPRPLRPGAPLGNFFENGCHGNRQIPVCFAIIAAGVRQL